VQEERAMSHGTLDKLIERWRCENLAMEQMIGQ